jgi:hypothetical protein
MPIRGPGQGGGGSAGVSSLNGLLGAINLVAGSNVTVTPVGNNISLASSGGGVNNLPPVYNVKVDGTAKGDWQQVLDGSMTSGSAVLTSAAGKFVAGDVGKQISVSGAASGGNSLSTTISSYTSATQVTLATTAGTTVTGAIVHWATDDTVAIQNAIAAAQNTSSKTLYIPTGKYLVGSTITNPLFNITTDGLKLSGDGIGKTIIQFADNVSLGNNPDLFRFSAKNAYISDISFYGGLNTTGNFLSGGQTIVNGGSGYAVNDILTVVGGVYNTPAQVKVTSVSATVITGLTIQTAGSYQATLTGPLTLSGGSGTGATFNPSWGTGFSYAVFSSITGSFKTIMDRIEVAHTYGGAISLVQTWDQAEFTTTLGTAVTAGAVTGYATITPPSMDGIWVGKRLSIDPAIKTAYSAQPSAAGTGYAVGDTLTLSGGTGTAAIFMVAAVKAVSATVAAGGSGYFVNDIITVNGGTQSFGGSALLGGAPAQFKVTATNNGAGPGAVTTVALQTAGSYNSTPSNNASTTDVTTTAASGCTLTVTYGAIDQFGSYGCFSAGVASGGSGYAVGDVISITNPTAGGRHTFLRVSSVSAGVINGLTVLVPGTFITAPSAGVATNTVTGNGTGATVNGTYQLNVNPIGMPVSQGAYSTPPNNAVSTTTSGSGTGCQINAFFYPEQVIVLANTLTTYTTAFANSHTAGVTVNISSEGRGYHIVRDSIVRDSYYANGIGLACRACKFDRNHIYNIGYNSLVHGVYNQGGENEYIGNWIHNCVGYGIQFHMSTPNMDAGGSRFIGNTVWDCQAGWLIIDSAGSPLQISNANNFAANPQLPIGEWMTRNGVISENYFYNSNQTILQGGAVVIGNPGVACVVQGNIFEDGVLTLGGAGSKAIGNTFRTVNNYNATSSLSISGNYSIAQGNTFENAAGNGNVINLNGFGSIVSNNTIFLSNNYIGIGVITVGASNCEVCHNTISGGAVGRGDSKPQAFSIYNNPTNLKIHDNDFSGLGVGSFIAKMGSNGLVGMWYNNNFGTVNGGFVNGANGLATPASNILSFTNNEGNIYGGTVYRTSKTLLLGQVPTAGLSAQTCVKWDSTAAIFTQCAVSDIYFLAVALGGSSGAQGVGAAIFEQGAEVPAVLTDGAWVNGNIGVLSSTAGGKIHDTGLTTPPASGSYVMFLNSGGSAGTARVRLLQTI